MSAWLVALVGVIYAGISVDLVLKGNYWLAVVFFGYALSNVGLWRLAQVQP